MVDLSFIKEFIYTNWLDLGIIIGIIVGSLIIGKVIYMFLRKYLEKITAKTESDVDDKILAATGHIIYILLFLAGLHMGLHFTAIADIYAEQLALIFSVAWIIIGAYLAIQVLSIIIEVYGKSKFGVGTAYLIKKVTMILISFIAFALILNLFNVEISPLLASLGIAGLAVALALQDTLANFFSGLYLTADQPIRPGDYIEVGTEIKGNVMSIGWRSTKLKTYDNNIIIVPNKTMGDSVIVNYSLPDSKILMDVMVDVSYKSDLDKVEKVVYNVAKKIRDKQDKQCMKSYDPVVRFNEFGDSGLKFKVFLQVKSRGDKFLVAHELRKALFKEFKKQNISIPFPTQEVYIRKAK